MRKFVYEVSVYTDSEDHAEQVLAERIATEDLVYDPGGRKIEYEFADWPELLRID